MIRFFPHATDNITSGSSAYAQSILRINYQYFLTGLVELQYAPDQQLVLLVCEGKDTGAFHVSEKGCMQIDPPTIPSLWKNGDGSIRSITLPRVALRAVRQVLEWSPPSQTIRAKNRSVLQDYINTCQAQRANGLLHFLWPRSEGYLTMRFGQALPMDTVFSDPGGTDTGSDCMAQILHNLDYPARISFLEADPDSVSYQQQTLQIALGDLLREILHKYSEQLGPGQAKALVSDLNKAMRTQSWYLQIVGDQFQDTHVFKDLQSAVEAYQILIKHLVIPMYNALGIQQTQSLFTDSVHLLKSHIQQTIQKYALLPAAANVR
jgi:hypothetical protein